MNKLHVFLLVVVAGFVAETIMIGCVVGLMEADCQRKTAKDVYCDYTVEVEILSINNEEVLLLLPGRWRGTDGTTTLPLPRNTTLKVGEEVVIYRSCAAECYTGKTHFPVNVFHWKPPKADRASNCVAEMVAWCVGLMFILMVKLVIVTLYSVVITEMKSPSLTSEESDNTVVITEMESPPSELEEVDYHKV